MSVSQLPSPGSSAYLALVDEAMDELFSAQQIKGPKTIANIQEAESRMFKAINSLQEPSREWSRDEMRKIYTGARRGNGDKTPMTKEQISRNSRDRKRQESNLTRAQADMRRWAQRRTDQMKVDAAWGLYNEQYKKALRAGETGKAREIKNKMAQLPKVSSVSEFPQVKYRTPNNRYGVSNREHPARDYFHMSVQAGYSRMNNLGIIEGAPDDAHFIVSDGPDCGWTRHGDITKANGTIVAKKEALRFPISHPYCHRSFTVADGPPGSRRLHKQMRELFGFSTKRELQRLAKQGPVLAKRYNQVQAGLKITNVIKSSKITDMLIRQIQLDAPDLLPKWAEKRINLWGNMHAGREVSYMQRLGGIFDSSIDPSHLAMEQIHSVFGGEDFLSLAFSEIVDVAPELQALLGLGVKEQKQTIARAIEEYGDFVAHRQALTQTPAERLFNNALSAEAEQNIYGGVAAMKLPFKPPRGAHIMAQMNQAYKSGVTLAKRESRQIGIEVVRDIAGIDMSPWWVKPVGNFKFSIGMTAESRRHLAENLFKASWDAVKYHNDEIDWARSIGLHLPDSGLTPRGIYRALQPRVTYSGKGIGATVALIDGKLVPMWNIHPPGAIMRNFGLRANLARKDFLEYVDLLKEDFHDGGILKVLKTLDEESVYTLDIFRHSPIQAQLKIQGRHIENWAVRTHSDQRWLGEIWRLWGHKAVALSDAQKTQIYADLIADGISRKQALRVIHIMEYPSVHPDKFFPLRGRTPYMDFIDPDIPALGQEWKYDNAKDLASFKQWILGKAAELEDRIWVARDIEPLPLIDSNNPEIIRNLMKLYAWHGNAVETARSAGISWESFMRVYNKYPEDFEDTVKAFNLRLGVGKSADMADRMSAWAKLTGRNVKANLKVEAGIVQDEAKNKAKRLRNRFAKVTNRSLDKIQESDWFNKRAGTGDLDWLVQKQYAEKNSQRRAAQFFRQYDPRIHNKLPNIEDTRKVAGEFSAEFRSDYDTFAKSFQVMFPGRELPQTNIGDDLFGLIGKKRGGRWTPAAVHGDAATFNKMYIDETAVKQWGGALERMMSRSYRIGHNVNDTSQSVLWHELGHWLSNEMADDEYVDLWRKILRGVHPEKTASEIEEIMFKGNPLGRTPSPMPDGLQHRTFVENNVWEHFTQEGIRGHIASGISNYASTDPQEFIAEMFADYMMNPVSKNKALSDTIGDHLRMWDPVNKVVKPSRVKVSGAV